MYRCIVFRGLFPSFVPSAQLVDRKPLGHRHFQPADLALLIVMKVFIYVQVV